MRRKGTVVVLAEQWRFVGDKDALVADGSWEKALTFCGRVMVLKCHQRLKSLTPYPGCAILSVSPIRRDTRKATGVPDDASLSPVDLKTVCQFSLVDGIGA